MKFNLNNRYKLRLTHLINHKLMHKVGKQWVVISLSTLALLLSTSSLGIIHADATTQSPVFEQNRSISQRPVSSNQQTVSNQTNKFNNYTTPTNIMTKAQALHNKLMNDENTHTIRLGSYHYRYRKARYRRYREKRFHIRRRRSQHRYRTSSTSSNGYARPQRHYIKRRKRPATKKRRRVTKRYRRRKVIRRHRTRASRTYLINNGAHNWPASPLYSNDGINRLKNGDTSDYSNDYSDIYNSDDPSVKVLNSTNIAGYNLNRISGSDEGDTINGWVFPDELSKKRSRHYRSNDINNLNKAVNQQFIQSHFTSNEQAQIASNKQQLDYLKQNEDSTNSSNIDTYRQNVIDWVNFYRGLHGLSPVTENSSFDATAQQSAEEGQDPEDSIPGSPNSDALPPSDVGIFYTDHLDADHNGHAGHRDSMLNPYATNIGVGVDGSTLTMYFHWGLSDLPDNAPVNVTYPLPGVFSLQDAKNGDYWSYQFNSCPSDWNYVNIPTPNVSVVDDSTDDDVDVTDVNTSGGFIFYNVNKSALKNGHEYTITIADNDLPNGGIQYNTKLYNLGDNVN